MMHKILFCSPNTSAFTKPVHKALIKLGYKTKVFDYQKGGYVSRSMGLIINNLPLQTKSFRKIVHLYINKQIINAVQSWKPDVVFVIKGAEITKPTLQQIHESKILLINWYPDAMDFWEWIKSYSPYYDYFFNMVYDVEQRLKKIHTHTSFIPPASDPDLKRNLERNFPITFVGQYSKRRERYFSEISDLGLKIWGYEKWQMSSLRSVSSPSVSNERCLNIIRRSKIVVNVLSGDHNYEPDVINMRTFETLGRGTFLLVQNHWLLHKYFTPGKDFVTFTTPRDLRTKAMYYLQHEQERDAIALRGWETVKSHHTFEIRLKELLKHVELS